MLLNRKQIQPPEAILTKKMVMEKNIGFDPRALEEGAALLTFREARGAPPTEGMITCHLCPDRAPEKDDKKAARYVS